MLLLIAALTPLSRTAADFGVTLEEEKKGWSRTNDTTMSNSDYLPDYPLNSDLVKRLKSALDAKDEERVGDLICTEVTPVDAVIELANDDWMKDPSAQLPPGMLLGNQNEPAASGTLLLSYADGWADPGGRGANV